MRPSLVAKESTVNDNNNNEILKKCEPLVYTRAQHTVQKQKKRKKRKARTVQQQ